MKNVSDFNVSDITGYRVIKKHIHREKRNIEYINLSCGFDIETTSCYVNIGLDKNGEAVQEKFAFMYEFTIGIADTDHIYYGRTWEEFKTVCEKLQEYFDLSDSRVLVIYVHNLGYEFQFMRKYFQWLNVFAVDDRKPIKALCSYGIEFRDSYILSALSLAKTAENLTEHTVKKLVGELDYEKIRHAGTPLTEQELAYCENDVIIVMYYIMEQMSQYGDITKIPMTNTGRVRKYVKNACYYNHVGHKKSSKSKYFKYRELMETLQLHGVEEYRMLKAAFQGGYTHCNSLYSGKVLEDVYSIDFTSSYPTVLIAEKYPMSTGLETWLTPEKGFMYYTKNYCCLYTVRFKNIRSKIKQDHYLSESKCKCINAVTDNGRVYSADVLETTITDVDFRIIQQCYEWESMAVKQPFYRYVKDYLPIDIIKSILHFYEQKTVLKGIDGKEVEYLLFKGMLNSVYGMMVTDIIRDEIVYEDDEWSVNPVTDTTAAEQITNYNESKGRFLFYPWGVWCTAYARRNLFLGVLNMGEDYIYSDTDSIKFMHMERHKKFIETYNNFIVQQLEKTLTFYGLDTAAIRPKNSNGEEKVLGVWDFEGCYRHFKSLGAKRYLVEHQDGSLHLTVAGLSKQNGIEYLVRQHGETSLVFDIFTDDLYIPAEETGKNTHTYIDDEREYDIIDHKGSVQRVNALSSIHLENAEYTLKISRQYAEFLSMLRKGYLYMGAEKDLV